MDDGRDGLGARDRLFGALAFALAVCMMALMAWLLSKALGLGFDLPWALTAGAYAGLVSRVSGRG